MNERMGQFSQVIRCLWVHQGDERLAETLNRKIEGYNRTAEETVQRCAAAEDRMFLLPQRIHRAAEGDNLRLWRSVKPYVLSRLERTVFLEPFCNHIAKCESHVRFEMEHYLSRATYYKYVSKGYEVARDFLLYHHLLELE